MALTPETVQLGRKYTHVDFKNTVYQGIRVNGATLLQVVRHPQGLQVGKFVNPPHDCADRFWDGFRAVALRDRNGRFVGTNLNLSNKDEHFIVEQLRDMLFSQGYLNSATASPSYIVETARGIFQRAENLRQEVKRLQVNL